MSGAAENGYAAFLGLWHAADHLLASRGLPVLDVEEATRLFRMAQDEEARITFRHLRGRFCAGTCPAEGQQ